MITWFTWLMVVLLGPVALALVVYAILVLLVGRTALDLAYGDQPGQPVLDRTDARYWKLGFYLNPQDSALFVPKRDPTLGTTINIGHRKGRLVAASILLGVALLLIVLIGALPLLALR
ncbi:MAG TPA: hypothetical protein VFN02_17150 [Ktedonobacteraceae bacterium]|nr:hypothetical protein [Ktedonobacteraceae bacterium]